MKITTATIALILATGAAAKEGVYWGSIDTITYDDRGAVFLTFKHPDPTYRGFLCERARFWAHEARRKAMLETVLAYRYGYNYDIGFRMADVPKAPDVCRITAITLKRPNR